MNPGQLLWKTLVDAVHNAAELIIVNVLWLVFTILVIPAPAAAAGLFYATHQLAGGRSITWRHFFEGFRKYWKTGLTWFLINTLVIIVLLGSFSFYARQPVEWFTWLQGFIVIVLFLWLLIQVFIFPLLLEQETPSIRTALRNSLVFYLRMPGYSLSLAFFLATLFYVSILLRVPWALFTVSLSSFLTSRFTLYMLSVLTGRKLEI